MRILYCLALALMILCGVWMLGFPIVGGILTGNWDEPMTGQQVALHLIPSFSMLALGGIFCLAHHLLTRTRDGSTMKAKRNLWHEVRKSVKESSREAWNAIPSGVQFFLGFVVFSAALGLLCVVVLTAINLLDRAITTPRAPSRSPIVEEINANLGSAVSQFRNIQPLLSSKPTVDSSVVNFEDGKWVIVNAIDWSIAKEYCFIKKERIPQMPSELTHVIVIGRPKTVSKGWYKYAGGRGSWEEFSISYTIWVIDWRKHTLILEDEILCELQGTSDSILGLGECYMEDQSKPRRTIIDWLREHGLSEYE